MARTSGIEYHYVQLPVVTISSSSFNEELIVPATDANRHNTTNIDVQLKI